MWFLLTLALVSHVPLPVTPTPDRQRIEAVQIACEGCGCRGGPGWRIHRTGQCAGKRNLAKECGSPPSPDLCTKEN